MILNIWSRNKPLCSEIEELASKLDECKVQTIKNKEMFLELKGTSNIIFLDIEFFESERDTIINHKNKYSIFGLIADEEKWESLEESRFDSNELNGYLSSPISIIYLKAIMQTANLWQLTIDEQPAN
ncbi:hypothetical protein OAB57_02890 [Bacteriovoracaceae bacterium]|nr:hypothetical protein [Bacteriovoracaceae bacterium]